MKWIDVIAAALGIPADQIRGALQAGADAAGPELNGGILDLLAKFESAVTDGSIGNMVAAVPAELTEVFKFHLNPRQQPGGFA